MHILAPIYVGHQCPAIRFQMLHFEIYDEVARKAKPRIEFTQLYLWLSKMYVCSLFH